jgi:heat shock protein HslJ
MGKRVVVFAGAMLLAAFLVFFNETEAGVTMAAAAGIEDTEWLLVEVSGSPVAPLAGGRRRFLKFDAVKKQVTGFAGCNNFFGSYERDGSSLKFGPVGSKRMSCPDLQLSLEAEFLKALKKTRAWDIRENVLLLLDDSEVLARFTEENIQGVTGTAWQWMQTLYNDDRKVVPADPKNYTVQFQEDGTLNLKADCNQKGGTYSEAQKRLFIEIIHSTMAVCPEGSLEDEFVRGLSAAAIYFIKDGDLYIDLKYDTGTMRFSQQKEK